VVYRFGDLRKAKAFARKMAKEHRGRTFVDNEPLMSPVAGYDWDGWRVREINV
jgi:hypothetical protein